MNVSGYYVAGGGVWPSGLTCCPALRNRSYKKQVELMNESKSRCWGLY